MLLSPLLRQTWVLTRKNILIAFNRHLFSTLLRAFALPLGLMVFLAYAKNLFVPGAVYGIGSAQPVRTLAQALHDATAGHNKIVFVNSGLTGGNIDRVIDDLAQQSHGTRVERLTNETGLLEICKSSLRGATSCYGAVVFHSSPEEGDGGTWNYTMRADGALGRHLDVTKHSNDVEVFLLPLQRAIDFAIAGVNTTIDHDALPRTTYEYPFTSLSRAQRAISLRVRFSKTIINVLGVAYFVALVGVTYHLTGFIATERESGMSQLIEAMMPNLKRWEPQAARFCSYHLAFDVIYLPGWILMGIPLGIQVFPNTSMAIVIVLHTLAGLSLTSMAIFGASFFKKAQLSGITLALTSCILAILAQVLSKSSTATVAILGLLFAPCNYVFFLVLMARYERQNTGTDLVQSAPASPWTVPGIVLWVFFAIQIFAYPMIGAYVEQYLYGTTSRGRTVVGRHPSSTTDGRESNKHTVQLQDFTKVYRPNWFRQKFTKFTKTPKEPVTAVQGLSLTASKGQILALLGANGSGKSTTLDAIAGLNTVTKGNITVDGSGGLGIAPQRNVLWDEVTIEEHLRIFNRLKSPNLHSTEAELNTLVTAIDLDRKAGSKAKTLSGGQKRKLQLGMMFTGGSSVCCVDEVSSGLDPLSRRKVWDILLAERGARTIIMTTHFLDEADLLADQIAILSKGTLRAKGSSVELKDKLGGGYRIHVQTHSSQAMPPKLEEIASHESFGQTVYIAPSSQQAAQIIRKLEEVNIAEYQLSGPTIEDVFLHLADETRAESMNSEDVASAPPTSTDEKGSGIATSVSGEETPTLALHSGHNISFLRQTFVLFQKRLTIIRRNYLPYAAAFAVYVAAAGLVTLLLSGFDGAGCAPADQVSASDVDHLFTQKQYDIPAGPRRRFSNAVLSSLFSPLLPPLAMTQAQLLQDLKFVDTADQFNEYIDMNFANITPAGIFLGDPNSSPLLAWQADNIVSTGIFGQNILNVMLTNISIATQYSVFDIPWLPSTGNSLQFVIYFALVMAAYPAFFALYPTVERTREIRNLEYSNSVRPLSLWLAYASFDFNFVLIASAISVGIFAATSTIWYHVGWLYIIFVLYGLAAILLSYIVSLFAPTQLAAFAIAAAGEAVFFFLWLVGYLCTLQYAPLTKIDSTLVIVQFTISLISPIGSLVRALFVSINLFSVACSGSELASYPGGILQYGGPILYLVVQIIVFFAILQWYDSGSVVAWYRRFHRKKDNADADTTANEDCVEAIVRLNSSNDGLRVLNLTKSFGHVTAVENLTFGVNRGEVFALLGPNGAGKSTTISLIRGDLQPSKNGGSIHIENIEINKHRANARSHLGVCAQFDAMDQMTVLEHLRFYARIRGVTDVEHNVHVVLNAVGLQAFSAQMAAKLSGGSKRKLSLGIAIIGNPAVLLLDEPSSGMDAAAKRIMWKTIARIIPGRSLLLTTHSMEEADALADRAGIMAGRMLAMGTSNQLRQKHGDAYYIHLVMKGAPHTTEEDISKLRTWVTSTFPHAVLEDKTFHGQIRFSVPAHRDEPRKPASIEITNDDRIHAEGDDEKASTGDMGVLITTLEDHRIELGLEHYSVSPTTLDQVFLAIVEKHNVEEENYEPAKAKRKVLKYLRGGWRKRSHE